VVHDPLGHPGPDSLDQPRAEVAADALDGRRKHRLVGLHLELAAVLGMAFPAAPQTQAFPGLRPKQRPDHRHKVSRPPRGHPGDGVAGLLVGVGDAFKHRVQRRGRDRSHVHPGKLRSFALPRAIPPSAARRRGQALGEVFGVGAGGQSVEGRLPGCRRPRCAGGDQLAPARSPVFVDG
jgi:hypothetical protein